MKKGFTLIELLGVIVVFSIVTFVAVPTILDIIEKAKIGAAKSSTLNYINAIENELIFSMLGNETYTDGEYEYDEINVNISGRAPTDGSFVIENGKIVSATFCVNGYNIEYNNSKAESTGKCDEVEVSLYENGTIVYFNPETNKICNAEESVSTTGTKTGCMKWYIFNDSDTSSKVNMILDHNTTARVQWNSDNDNTEMKEVKQALESDTSTWDSSLNARLITADEIVTITSNNDFDNSMFCLDATADISNYCAKEQGTGAYAWLYDNTYRCTNYGCNVADDNNYTLYGNTSTGYIYGYWTSAPYSDVTVWTIDSDGFLGTNDANNNSYGLRPVITISKKVLK